MVKLRKKGKEKKISTAQAEFQDERPIFNLTGISGLLFIMPEAGKLPDNSYIIFN